MYEGNVLNLEPNGAIVAAVVLAAFQGVGTRQGSGCGGRGL